MTLTEFVYPGCPYCRQAADILQQLFIEHPEFDGISIQIINELAQPQLAEKYDYYRTPSFFDGDCKLYEADPRWDRQTVEKKLEDMLSSLVCG